ncbi:MAG TPA: dihydrofolate reductase family protein [Allosphingosinicella sp.]|nr:dihydrofolate reductase family protein [Allosphingosinicella sp.]
MRKVTWGAACSLDLMLTGPDGGLDWLRWSDDAAQISGARWQGVDTLLMGRKTWDFAARSGGGGDAGDSPIRTFIFSRTMTEAPKGATLVATDPAAFVREFKQKEGGDIIVMGGGDLASQLIEGGVVDEIGLNVHPVLLGGGIPFFRPMARQVSLVLREARPIAKDCVFLRYGVAR